MQAVIRVLVIDDSTTMRALIDNVMTNDRRFHVVGVPGTLAAARQLIDQTKPDVLTLDVELPDGNGLDFLEGLCPTNRPAVVVISSTTAGGSPNQARAKALGAEAVYDKAKVMGDPAGFRRTVYEAAQRRPRAESLLGSAAIAQEAIQGPASRDPVETVPAPVPADERRRIEIVSELGLDRERHDARFDLVTDLLADMLDFPLAMLNIIGRDQQFVKSSQGDQRLDITATRREDAFCNHTIAHDGVLVVPDARKDPRFAENPLVVGTPGIRFYAGTPITAADGTRLGALCVIDFKPRTLNEDRQRLLEKLGRLASDRLAA